MSKSALGNDPFELLDSKTKKKSSVNDKSKSKKTVKGSSEKNVGLSEMEKVVDKRLEKFKNDLYKSLKVIKNPEQEETVKTLIDNLESIFVEAQELLDREKTLYSLEKKKPTYKLSSLLKKLKDSFQPSLLTSDISSVDIDDFGLDRDYYGKVSSLIDFFYEKWFRVTLIGVENLRSSTGALLVANHAGLLPWDAIMLSYGVQKETGDLLIRPLIEDVFFYFPFIGEFFSKVGGIRANYENAKKLLDRDEFVAFFPEGMKGLGKVIKERYKLQRFARGGVVKLHLETGKPIIPVGIVGSEEIYPIISTSENLARKLGVSVLPLTVTFPWLGPIGLLPLPTKWYIAIGEPVDFTKKYGKDAINDELLVSKLTRELRGMVHELLYETLKNRGSVFLG